MKRLRRWIFNSLLILSTLLCLGTAMLWVRSYWVDENVLLITPGGAYWEVFSGRTYVASSMGIRHICQWPEPPGVVYFRSPFPAGEMWVATILPFHYAGEYDHRICGSNVGFVYGRAYPMLNAGGLVLRVQPFPHVPDTMTIKFAAWTSYWVFYLPPWLALLVFSALPALTVLNRLRRRLVLSSRARRGLCPTCGYNLTANISGVCPECGAKIHNTRD